MPMPLENRYTYADVLDWPEDERSELIDGKVFLMSPPMRIHQKVCGEIFLQIANYLRGKRCEAYSAPFGVRLFEKKDDKPHNVDTFVEPDITVVCDPDKLDDYGCKGAPDLVIEVLSPSTRQHDRVTKFNLYQKAGVQEYWIVDPDARGVMVMTLEEGQYHAPMLYTHRDIVPVGVLEDCSVDLSAVFSEEEGRKRE